MAEKSIGIGTVVALIIAYNVFFGDDADENKTIKEVKETTKQVVEVVKEKAPEVAEDVKKAVAEAKQDLDEEKKKEEEKEQVPVSSGESVDDRFKNSGTYSDRFK